MGKIQKRNIFSPNPWNDTPYYDVFVEEWVKYGVIDTNNRYEIYEKNKPFQSCQLTKHEIYKWPERI